MANLTEVKIPDIGDASGVDVIEVLVNVGDEIDVDDSLIVLETDKATMEVPSSDAGVVKSVEVKVGDKVSEGDLIVKLEATESGGGVDSSNDSSNDSRDDSSDDSDGKDSGSEAAEETPAPEKSAPAPSAGGKRSEPIIIPDIGD